MSGVFKVLVAADIPPGGKNNIFGPNVFNTPAEVEEVKYQPF